MIEWGLPWIMLALPLPWLAARILRPADHNLGAALRVPFFNAIQHQDDASVAQGHGKIWRRLLHFLVWSLLLVAAAQPQWTGDPIKLPQTGRDLLVAVDISGSMQEPDMDIGGRMISRLNAVKLLGGKFIERRKGDRLGLILFGEQAYLQTPLTFDRKTVSTMLREAEIGLAGKGTAIGDAIGLAVKRMRADNAKDRVLILMTDGANNAGQAKPSDAAQLAHEQGLKIYTIGIGSDPSLASRMGGFFGRMVQSDLDEPALKQIASLTGGRYFRARDPNDLANIYATLDELEPSLRDEKTFRPIIALFMWPLGAALLLSVLLALSIVGDSFLRKPMTPVQSP